MRILHRVRKVCFFCYMLCLITVITVMHITSQYDLRDHKYTHKRLMDLPSKREADVGYSDYLHVRHIWQPGSEYAFVDPKEPYLKKHGSEKMMETGKLYKILHYNEDFHMSAHNDTAVIRDTCSYQNCHFTNDRKLFRNSSAVIYSLSFGRVPMGHVPPKKVPGQVWIFFDREPPIINEKVFFRHRSWNNVMNWSLSYRPDSDIVYPYGVLRTREPAELPARDYSAIYRQKTKFAFWLVSNCNAMVFSSRNEYVRELSKHIPVDIYGSCGTPAGHNISSLFSQYKFYLSLENSFCRGYVTEKFFNKYSQDVVLVTRGGFDYDRYFPSDTFINAGNFPDAASLAHHLLRINKSEQTYTEYLRKKDKYKVGKLNWQCQMCAKLNQQERYQNVYDNVVSFWNKNACWRPDDVPSTWPQYYALVLVSVVLLVIAVSKICKIRKIRQTLFE